MFDIGFWEFALIGVITLIIVGPEKMPAIARTVGRYVGKAKQFVAKVQADIDAEIDTDEIKKHLHTMDKNTNILEVFDDTKKAVNDIKKDVEKS
ncbi:sec-independent protein translocase protein TatB [Bathymodiolus thermophilus thioautotrophic gill symbiont]|uniref:Sec-independent protein translocase protein TatB n=1 Tax=Bathymodiolus thermophilus thioautotrophic gill symbiont TaxID=2360 RepID=A0A3G3IK00_9GAMM|nr:Sec-independent protein translocase protein TatB [Bathymodiolus thermophilus thioautotrophic gill symbiont]AYQ56173.1 sec-independent protein translocase protein TatB [Bathymodiolus thermophilus thioautotrophic gill symbiont]CAB5502395.1 Twin-arginine translocation protein TatB [Bathymodiolus thermophilus thioautotrophic gill symbiont]